MVCIYLVFLLYLSNIFKILTAKKLNDTQKRKSIYQNCIQYFVKDNIPSRKKVNCFKSFKTHKK